MNKCPYPEKIIDEASGVEVTNPEYVAFEAGRKEGWERGFSYGIEVGKIHGKIMQQEGRREVVEWIESRHKKGYLSFCGLYINWQAKLKEWLPEEEK